MSVAWENWLVENLWWYVVPLMILVYILEYVIRGRCPACNKYFSFHKTGKRDGYLYEYECTTCKHLDWIDRTPPASNG